MAKRTFALEMNGIEIKTLEDLRENFDLEKAVEYFKSGELLEWLEDRFYDDEAEKIENISVDDKNLSQKICAALNVECDEDLEFTQRVREKKKILAEKTDDENIIDNAMTTALNQDDLANLLHMDYSTIYLCGENFTVPIRVENKKYVGVLSTPKIKIRANSDEELAAKNISFENCRLPFMKATLNEELKALAEKIFENKGRFPIVDNVGTVNYYDSLSRVDKSIVLRTITKNKYDEQKIIYMMLTEDLTSGFALTEDSICFCDGKDNKIFEYKSISDIETSKNTVSIKSALQNPYLKGILDYSSSKLSSKFLKPDICRKIKDFLNVVKNF